MSGEARTGPGGHARPVADAPIDGLLARTEELAKRWVLALVDASPLDEIETLKLAPLARSAPSLCAAVLAALRSDDPLWPERSARAESDSERGAPARDPLCLEWVADPREAVFAVEALRGVLWEALVYAAGVAALTAPSERLVSDLADRLAYLCSVVLTRSLPGAPLARAAEPHARTEAETRRLTPPWVGSPTPGEPAMHRRDVVAQRRGRAEWREAGVSREPRGTPSKSDATAADRHRPPEGVARTRAVLVDEFSEPRATRSAASRARAGEARGRAGRTDDPRGRDAQLDGRALPWDIPLLGGRGGQARERAVEPPQPRADGLEPKISVTRRRPPRERE